MKKVLVMLLVAVLALPALYSCTKKGEEDPGLSLRSRKSRLTGEWTLESGTMTASSGSTTASYTYTASTVTINYGGSSNTFQYTETAVYEKDNTFKRTVMYDGELSVTEGFWAFIGGYDEVKKEECIVLRTKSVIDPSGTQVYTGDQMPSTVLRLKRLSNKEIFVENEGTQTSGSTTYNVTSSMTYIRK